MATVTRELIYRCADDCQMSGCPGHDGRLDYQSVSDSYTFTMNGRELFFERGELDAMIDLLVSVDRADAANAEALSRAPIAEGGGDGEYSQGVMGDGAAILHNGVPMTIDAIVGTLNRNAAIESLSRQGGDGMFASKFIEWNRSRPEPYVRVGFEMVAWEHFLQYGTRASEAGDWVLVPRECTTKMELALSDALATGNYSIAECLDKAIAAAPADGGG